MMKHLPHLLLPLLLAHAGLMLAADAAPEQERQRELQQQKALLEARIDTLQQQDDPYTAGLQESWFELGSILQELDAFEEASQAYSSAWQAARISTGLEDPQQLAILRRLASSQRAAQQWEEADTTAHLIHHISSRSYPPGAAERLDAVLQLGRWKLLAARDALLPDSFSSAWNAADIFSSEIARLEALDDYPERRIQLATLHLERASAEFLLANEIREQPLQEYFVSGQRSTTMLQCTVTRLPDGRAQQICVPVEIPNLDFYVDPSNRKNQEMWRHLEAMRDGVEASFNYLKDENELVEQRDALLADMQALTETYNSFVTDRGQ
jgi:hypothetical protein